MPAVVDQKLTESLIALLAQGTTPGGESRARWPSREPA
jgi:hypothetical protein